MIIISKDHKDILLGGKKLSRWDLHELSTEAISSISRMFIEEEHASIFGRINGINTKRTIVSLIADKRSVSVRIATIDKHVESETVNLKGSDTHSISSAVNRVSDIIIRELMGDTNNLGIVIYKSDRFMGSRLEKAVREELENIKSVQNNLNMGRLLGLYQNLSVSSDVSLGVLPNALTVVGTKKGENIVFTGGGDYTPIYYKTPFEDDMTIKNCRVGFFRPMARSSENEVSNDDITPMYLSRLRRSFKNESLVTQVLHTALAVYVTVIRANDVVVDDVITITETDRGYKFYIRTSKFIKGSRSDVTFEHIIATDDLFVDYV